MYNASRELIEALSATGDVLTALLRNVSPAQARESRGGDEHWSVVEVVCHLRDTETFILERMRAIRDHVDPVITGFDQVALAVERDYVNADLRTALAAFLATRAQHVAELQALTPDQWERCGHHAQHGATSISNHTLHMVWHDVVHTAQIARQLNV